MLINLDEFEGMSGRELNAFKDLVTRKVISFRLPYARRSQNFPHTASFAGTCNYQEVLHDTGYQYSIGSKIQLGKVMTKHHFESKKGNNGRRYAVFIIDIEQVKSNRLYE